MVRMAHELTGPPTGPGTPDPLTGEAGGSPARRAGPVARPAHAVRTWLVSVDLPIEAATPADAVHQFWSYVRQLGPSELPAYVRPSDDELAMRAYVLGVEVNQDPEEDG